MGAFILNSLLFYAWSRYKSANRHNKNVTHAVDSLIVCHLPSVQSSVWSCNVFDPAKHPKFLPSSNHCSGCWTVIEHDFPLSGHFPGESAASASSQDCSAFALSEVCALIEALSGCVECRGRARYSHENNHPAQYWRFSMAYRRKTASGVPTSGGKQKILIEVDNVGVSWNGGIHRYPNFIDGFEWKIRLKWMI